MSETQRHDVEHNLGCWTLIALLLFASMIANGLFAIANAIEAK